MLVQSRRNTLAASKFFRRLLKGLGYVPRVLVTHKLASYSVAHREREMKRFHLGRARATLPLRFLGHFAAFPAPPAPTDRGRVGTEMADRFALWREITATDVAA